MRSRLLLVGIVFILVVCLVCPLVELFDQWDHTLQTGNDTEYTLVILALCIGAAYSFTRFIFKFCLFRCAGEVVSNACAAKLLPSPMCGSQRAVGVLWPYPPFPLGVQLRCEPENRCLVISWHTF
jgi:hypothetical protein